MPRKIIVAVHGIGEQVRCETIQSVAYQFCKYCGVPTTIPLGRLCSALNLPPDAPGVPGAVLIKTPPDPGLPDGLGFGEIYWADIPRGPAKNLYTLEETKKWARTVVERVRASDPAMLAELGHRPADFRLAAQVIEEMIETSRILDRLLFLADKVGLFRFDLKQLLIDYLGDVQVVTEFENYREQIVGLFLKVMAQINKDHPDAEIYVVAHSEGTVIAFLGLLEALHTPGSQRAPWAEKVRGLMTIGSPINKHLLLWPELWDQFPKPHGPPLPSPIPWRNYYDYGDPVGFRLDTARNWLTDHGWDGYFDFQADKHDIGFTRYYFAGKAHNDYWDDEGVFGHFIHTVVRPQPAPAGLTTPAPVAPTVVPAPAGPPPTPWPARDDAKYPRPGTLWLPFLVSPTLPYLLAAALVLLGVFLLYKAVGECLGTGIDENLSDAIRNVTGVGYLLVGLTAAVRIPRLTKHWGWRLASVGLLLSTVWVFPLIVTNDFLNNRIGRLILVLDRVSPATKVLDVTQPIAQALGIAHAQRPAVGILCLVGLTFLISCVVSWWRPSWGAKPLLFLGGAIIFGIVAFRLSPTHQDEARLREALANQAGLRGSLLTETTNQVMGKVAENPAWAQDFDRNASREAKQILAEPKFRTRAGPKSDEPDDAIQPVAAIDVGSVGQPTERGPLWPVILAGAAFLYLWWLAALLFDMVVVWQHYIRNSAIIDRLQAMRGMKPEKPADGKVAPTGGS